MAKKNSITSGFLLTICIPTYNRSEALDSCLFAICSQINFYGLSVQVIVSDNCSTDETEQVVKKWAISNSYVKYYKNKENIGGIRNFWRVTEYVSSKYFWFMGDDALVMPGAIKHTVDVLKNNDVGFLILAGTNNILDQSRFLQERAGRDGLVLINKERNDFLSSFSLQTLGCISFLVFRTDLWRATKYNEQPPYFIYPQIRSVIEVCGGAGMLVFSNRYCVHNYRASALHNDWYLSKAGLSVVLEFPWLQSYAISHGFDKYYPNGLHKKFLSWKIRQWLIILSFHPHYKSLYDEVLAQQLGADKIMMLILKHLIPPMSSILQTFIPKSRKETVAEDDLSRSA